MIITAIICGEEKKQEKRYLVFECSQKKNCFFFRES
jgi:hypothetical protein